MVEIYRFKNDFPSKLPALIKHCSDLPVYFSIDFCNTFPSHQIGPQISQNQCRLWPWHASFLPVTVTFLYKKIKQSQNC